MKRPVFAPHRQTKSQNRLAYAMWKAGVQDNALATCDPASIARSYGLPVEEVSRDVLRMRLERSVNANAR
jgi:hypothetical protein